MSEKKVLIILADGFEEIEAVTVIDILRRASLSVVMAGLVKRNVSGSHGIRMICDSVLEEELNKTWDMIILPGGTLGVSALAADPRVKDLLLRQQQNGGDLAALCAAPGILAEQDMLGERAFTVHPALEQVTAHRLFKNLPVVTEPGLITGRSAGAAMDFAFALLKELTDEETAAKVNEAVIWSGR